MEAKPQSTKPFAGIRAVTFDAANTLLHPKPSVGAIYREVMLQHGLDYQEAELQDGFRRAFSSIHKDTRILDGEARERSYWQQIVRHSIEDLTPQPQDFDALFESLWQEFAYGHRWQIADGAKQTLASLRDRGFIVALLTNWDSRVRSVLNELQLQDAFDHVFISSELNAEKPDPEIFQQSAARLELEPHQILHIGDSYQHDIRGAQDAGWRCIRLTHEDKHQENGYRSIRHLADVLELL